MALDQFSFSEHEGYLRVATTEVGDDEQSYVTVLADVDQALVQVGQVGGLGRGERIQAVRFIGPVGYVVTFRQTDPLYTVDLSDPRQPRVVGELKLLGYSAYLHPLDDGRLLGVGQDATEQGQRQGSQVSLFDVSQPAAPKLLAHRSLGQGESPAEFDHHAFLWWPATRLSVLPFVQYGDSGPVAAAVGITVGSDTLTETGRVQHPASADYGGSPAIDRSLVIGDRLYTLSQAGLMASNVASLAQEAWVPFS
jgi:uncharacterized secreted protein with C-terminal beta-propeller domain